MNPFSITALAILAMLLGWVTWSSRREISTTIRNEPARLPGQIFITLWIAWPMAIFFAIIAWLPWFIVHEVLKLV